MARPTNKPWGKGFIPPPTKPRAYHPPIPEGWVRIRRNDCTHFVRAGTEGWLQDVIIGKPGALWRLWIDKDPNTTEPTMAMKSLETLLVWYRLETSNRPREEAAQRHLRKAAAHSAAYRSGKSLFLGTLLALDEQTRVK